MTPSDTIRAHGVSVSLDPMEELLKIEKHRLIQSHEEQVAELNAHASELGNKIRELNAQIERQALWKTWAKLGLVALGMAFLYFAVRDLGC
jgi:hypothetical protein